MGPGYFRGNKLTEKGELSEDEPAENKIVLPGRGKHFEEAAVATHTLGTKNEQPGLLHSACPALSPPAATIKLS